MIRDGKNDELFKKCLIFLLDGNITTGISKKKMQKKVSIVPNAVINSLDEAMEYLKIHNTGTDLDIANVRKFINSIEEDYEIYEGIITKSLKLGCDAKTVNKAIPGLIEQWEVQLGSAFNKLKLRDGEWFSLSQKMNGNRASYYKGELISRQGKIFSGMDHIILDLETIDPEMFYDGELIRKNIDGLSDGENFRIGTGIINSDVGMKPEIKFVIFDVFPADELADGKSNQRYRERKKKLQELRKKISEQKLKNIEVVTMVYEGTDQSKIMEYLDEATNLGWEGLMLNKNTVYECKRTLGLIKIKKFYTMDLQIVGILEGDGRLKGTAGAIAVKFGNNIVNVGSGFDDKSRDFVWRNRKELIGRIAEIKYKEISKDKKTGLESLQFPVFVQIREKGKEISYD